jgi:hypothetical protein
MSTIEALEAKLAALESKIESLEARLERERALRSRLMRDTHCCPVCQGGRVLFVEWVQNQTATPKFKLPISLAADIGFWGAKYKGIFQLFVCEACGYTETQIDDAKNLEGNLNVKLLEVIEDNPEPYR